MLFGERFGAVEAGLADWHAAMRRQLGVTDACGMTWILGELWRALPLLARERTPMPWRALRQWHRLRRAPLAFPDARAVEAPV